MGRPGGGLAATCRTDPRSLRSRIRSEITKNGFVVWPEGFLKGGLSPPKTNMEAENDGFWIGIRNLQTSRVHFQVNHVSFRKFQVAKIYPGRPACLTFFVDHFTQTHGIWKPWTLHFATGFLSLFRTLGSGSGPLTVSGRKSLFSIRSQKLFWKKRINNMPHCQQVIKFISYTICYLFCNRFFLFKIFLAL